MAKINLLTMHYGICYGAALQTYATCKVLGSLGHDVTIINLQDRRKFLLSYIKKMRFNDFYKKHYPQMTKLMYLPILGLMPNADYFLVGSDQVWNPNITKSKLMNYFLDFVPSEFKRISYASSFGKDKWSSFLSKSELSKIKEELEKFSAISVRENSGVDICRKEFGLNVTQVLDPTLLLNDYSELIGNSTLKNDIVCFFIGFKRNKGNFLDVVDTVKKELKLKTTYLDATALVSNFDNHCFMPSPKLWVRKLFSAEFIITSSYHGLAFALIFRKPFIILQSDELKIVRLKSLLSLLHLEDRLILCPEELKSKASLLHENIDYDEVYRILDIEKENSISFLRSNLIG